MKKTVLFCVAAIFALSMHAYPFGGSPPPKAAGTQPAAGNVPATQTAQMDPVQRKEALLKAKSAMSDMKAELKRISGYIWLLETKIVEAKRNGNAERVTELMLAEQEALDKAKTLKEGIFKLNDEFPELVEEAPGQTAIERPAEPKPDIAIESTPVERPTNTVVYHYVAPGDTLMSISRKYFNSPSYYKDIAMMNGITDMSSLQRGMRLKIDMSLKNRPKSPSF